MARRFAGFRIAWLNHADDAVILHGVVEHREIARLENIQWQLRARQDQHARQRKYGNDVRQIRHGLIWFVDTHVGPLCRVSGEARLQENSAVESLRRAVIVSGSIWPQASK